ncbi:hypothetical protein GDO81_001738 [Engystomops pustulosus]|uniref:ER membrane protein complex subunit 9 n=1 Tax=Engystomops pustulosus TaxID=76066 RepID=A0AAV7DGK3_ENGPU|nr:hypothetical protein GDO81_001738 [Engystomops pustulosus]
MCEVELSTRVYVKMMLHAIDSWSALQGLVIAGFYQANSGLRDTSINSATLRSASLIAEYQDDAVLILMDNERLTPSPGIPPLTVLHQNSNKNWVPKEKTLVMWGHWEETQRITRHLLQAKAYQRLIDFDTHLEDIRTDWTNEALNVEITRLATVANGST